jgi:hypothetical protein
VAISNDDTGISEDPDVRFAVAKKIVERAADFGIPAHDIVVDPLVMPIGAMATAGQQVFTLVRRLREELGVNTTCGASNISFGLPNRHGINNAFLPMAIEAGMTSAIMNPVALPVGPKAIAEKKALVEAAGVILPEDMDDEAFVKLFGMGSTKPRAGKEMEAIRAANFLMNHDDGGGRVDPVQQGPGRRAAGRPRRRSAAAPGGVMAVNRRFTKMGVDAGHDDAPARHPASIRTLGGSGLLGAQIRFGGVVRPFAALGGGGGGPRRLRGRSAASRMAPVECNGQLVVFCTSASIKRAVLIRKFVRIFAQCDFSYEKSTRPDTLALT